MLLEQPAVVYCQQVEIEENSHEDKSLTDIVDHPLSYFDTAIDCVILVSGDAEVKYLLPCGP